MAQKKFKQLGKENGLHIVRFEDGSEARVTDAELHTMKTGLPATDKEALKAANAETKAVRGELQTATKANDELQGKLSVATATNEELTTQVGNLERERDTLKEENQTLAQQVKDLQAAKPAANAETKAVPAAPENKAVVAPPETK
jgi:uncharacterized protein (DUF3084 family)